MNAPSKKPKAKTPTKKNDFSYRGMYSCHRVIGELVGEWQLISVFDTKKLKEAVKQYKDEPDHEHYVLVRMVEKGSNKAETHILSGVSRKEADAELKRIASSPSSELKEAA